MKRTWIVAGLMAAGVAGLAGTAYATSDRDGEQRGPGYTRDGPRDGGERGPRWRDRDGDERRGPRYGRGGDDCGPGMHRGRGGRDGEYGMRGREFDRGDRGRGWHEGMRGGMRHGGPAYGLMRAAEPAELESIKKEIGVTAEQEQAWTAYTAAVKETAEAARTRRDGIDRNAVREMSRDDRRAFMDGMRDQRRKEIDAVADAASELVKTLDEKQTAIAKEILPGYAKGYGQRRAGRHHGMERGGRHHRHDER